MGLLRRPRRDAGDVAHRRTRGAAVAVPHHRPVLTDPGVAADRSQRNHGRHGDGRGVHRGLPRHQRTDPGRDRPDLGGARRTRVEHLLRRQVASDPDRGIQSGCHQTALAAVPRVRAVLRIPRRRDRPVVPRAGLRQPSGRGARHSRAGLSPLERPGRQDHRVHPGLDHGRAGQAMVHLPVPRRRPRPPSRVRRVGRPLRGPLRHGLRALPRHRAGEPEEAGHCAAEHRAVRGEPVPGRHRARWPTVAAAGHRAAVGRVVRRREAVVRPDGGGVRRLPFLHRRPDRTGARLSRRIRPARQHHHRGDLRQRRQRRGWPQRFGERGQVLQRLHRHRRGQHALPRRVGRSVHLQPLSDRLGDGLQHALQAVQALRLPRGGYRRHRNHLVAQRDCGARRGQGQLRQRLRYHPDSLRVARYRRAGDGARYRPEAAGGREFQSGTG